MSLLVSCITPTYNRRDFLPRAIELFLAQDYPSCELIVVDDGTDCVRDLIPDDPRIRYFRLPERLTVGAKRNFACRQARGRFIVHWDDDDWYPPDRISTQVDAIQAHAADYSGSSHIYFIDDIGRAAWLYRYQGLPREWVAGTTLAYRREMWERTPFPEVNVGEDTYFLLRARAKGIDLKEPRLAIASIHRDNICPRQTSGMFWTGQPYAAVRGLQQEARPIAPARVRAIAFICAYNEADIIRWTIRHLLDQGVSTYLIDNGSTDGTAAIAAEYPLAGCERVPRQDPPSWVQLLQLVEKRAAESRAEWCLHHDADEIRRVPAGGTLAEGLGRLAAQGYTAVDHDVYEFAPTQDGFDGSQNPESFFSHYRPGTLNQRCGQIKTWRNLGPVDLARSGGHAATASWIRVAPERWTLKHYPLRSQDQGARKVFRERNWSLREKSWNWHVQYNEIRPDHRFVRPECELTKWGERPKLAIVSLTRYPDVFADLARSLEGCMATKLAVTSGGAEIADPSWIAVPGIEPFVFARNVNVALQHAACAGCDVLVVNDDVRFRSPSDPYVLQDVAHGNDSIGIVSPKIAGGVGNRNQSVLMPSGPLFCEDRDRLCFVCVLIRAEALHVVGPLDERFNGYGGDDDDYCLRARQAGFRLAITDRVTVDHGRRSPIAASTSFLRVMTDEERVASMRNMRECFLKKHGLVRA